MNTFRLCLILTLSLLGIARADLTMVQKIEGTGPVKQITIKIKGDKARLEASPEITMLIDNKSGEIVNLLNSQKKFMRMSADQTKAVADLIGKRLQDSSGAANTKFAATGKKETIDGYETEEYVRETPSIKQSCWVAPKYPDGAAILKQLQSIKPAAFKDLSRGAFEFGDLPGLPLRTTIKMDKGETKSSLVSVSQASLNDAEFAVPKDFQEFKMPNLQDVLSEKASKKP
jgi:hypothetical protein